MVKITLLLTALFIPGLASASASYSAERKAALIVYQQGEGVYNYLYCDVQDREQVRLIMSSIGEKPGAFDSKECQKLTKNGISVADVERELPNIKKQMIEFYLTMNRFEGGFLKNITGDKEGPLAEEDLSQLTQAQKDMIQSLTVAALIEDLDAQARSPIIRDVESEDLDSNVARIVGVFK